MIKIVDRNQKARESVKIKGKKREVELTRRGNKKTFLKDGAKFLDPNLRKNMYKQLVLIDAQKSAKKEYLEMLEGINKRLEDEKLNNADYTFLIQRKDVMKGGIMNSDVTTAEAKEDIYFHAMMYVDDTPEDIKRFITEIRNWVGNATTKMDEVL